MEGNPDLPKMQLEAVLLGWVAGSRNWGVGAGRKEWGRGAK